MKTVTVIFDEPLHHVCLMSGLKQTYARMPFLNKRMLEVRGKMMTIDNIVPPPPMMKNPSRRTGIRGTRNMVGVSYWKNKLSIEYREDMCSCEDITAFVNSLIEDYMHFRHPFMKITIKDGKCYEQTSGHLIAKII
ncbi:MAG: hypothetical protein E7114_10470 [Bacteroidales bacterium]|nr:hypothetical protein [Bacteroidales bacterium]